jgi:hypothetical protein
MLIQLAPGGVVWPAAIMMWGPGYAVTDTATTVCS